MVAVGGELLSGFWHFAFFGKRHIVFVNNTNTRRKLRPFGAAVRRRCLLGVLRIPGALEHFFTWRARDPSSGFLVIWLLVSTAVLHFPSFPKTPLKFGSMLVLVLVRAVGGFPHFAFFFSVGNTFNRFPNMPSN